MYPRDGIQPHLLRTIFLRRRMISGMIVYSSMYMQETGLHVYEYGYGIYVREVLTEAVDEMDMAAPELARRSLVGVVFAL